MKANIQTPDGRPVAFEDLSEDDQLIVTNYELGYNRGWREGIEHAAKAIVEGKVPGMTYGGAPAKAQPFDVSVAPQSVTFNLPAPVVTVTPASEMKITSMPDRLTYRRVERDARGLISQVADHESDGSPAA